MAAETGAAGPSNALRCAGGTVQAAGCGTGKEGAAMDQNVNAPALSFRKRLFGYDPVEVDAYLAKAVETHEAVRAEVERLRAAEPLARVGGDVANLLTMFAETVSSMRDEAAGEIDRLRAEAVEYAEQQRAEADEYALHQRSEADEYAMRQRGHAEQILAESRDRAQDEADALLDEARHELASVATRWGAIERALTEAAGGVASALAAVQRFSGFTAAETIDIADHRQYSPPAPVGHGASAPQGGEQTDPSSEASHVSGMAEDPDDPEAGSSVLPSLAAKMWQSQQSRPAGSGSRLQYLLPRSGTDEPAD